MRADVGDALRVRLLGPVDLLAGGVAEQVQGLRRKAVLAVLALHVGEVATIDRLLDAVWGNDAPSTAVNTLQRHVSHLRRILGSRATIVARSAGYALNLAPGGTDVDLAEREIAEATRATDFAVRAGHLSTALALWRGPSLGDVAIEPWLAGQAQRLDRLRARAQRMLIESRLALGDHEQLVPELERYVGEHPFDEQLHGQLMVALYRSGRQADALETFHRLRVRLDEELGIAPGKAIRDIETAILRQEGDLEPVPAAGVTVRPVASVLPTPAQLPPQLPVFSGRIGALAELDAALFTAETRGLSGAFIAVISGMAGVGKSTLAVHWAHRVADRFPDGQLYVNLRGFDPSGTVLDPAEAIRGFLDAYGVPPQRIPATLQAQIGLYRSLLAGKRVLVVLDNARDVEQVRPLLPGSAGCLTVVTSRNQLTGLMITDGAYPLTLDLLAPAEAHELLTRRLGVERLASDPDAVADIIAYCARLPLALAVAAARLASRPDLPLPAFAAGFEHATGTLDALQGGDATTDVRTVFDWSYRTLSPGAARMFRLLGLHPGPDVSAAAAASLAAVTVRQAQELIAELVHGHLVTEQPAGRYAFHDLLRAYATAKAQAEDSGDDRRAASHRMLDHYLHTANTATRLLTMRHPIELKPPQHGTIPEALGDGGTALAWLGTEHRVLLAAVEQAAATDFSTHAWQLVWALRTFLNRRAMYSVQIAIGRTALDAALRDNDVVGQARTHHGQALGYMRWGRFDEAHVHFNDALRLYAELGDRVALTSVYQGLAELAEKQGHAADVLRYAQRVLAMYRELGDPVRIANAVNGVGWGYALVGEYQPALAHCQEALGLLQELGDTIGETSTWASLGYIYRGLGDPAQAIACYRHTLDMCRKLGYRYHEADALNGIGDAHHDAGRPDAARTAWQEALEILDELEHPSAGEVRAKCLALTEVIAGGT